MSKYQINESFFDNITTENQAYWLGFLAADGNVQPHRIALELGRKDRLHLNRFLSLIAPDMPIKDRTRTTGIKTSSITICSRHLSSTLIALGLVPAKSLVMQPWQGPKGLMRHYWRGLVDGDGCLTRNKKRKNGGYCYVLNLCGNQFVVPAFADFVADETGIKKKVYNKGKIRVVEYNGTSTPQLVAKLLYDKSKIYLPRKKEIAEEIIASKILKYNRSNITLNQLNEMRALTDSWKSVATNLCMSPNNLNGLKRKLLRTQMEE